MRRLEHFFDIDLEVHFNDKLLLEKFYLTKINSTKYNRITPYENLESYLNELLGKSAISRARNSNKIHFLRILLNYLPQFILMQPENMNEFNKRIERLGLNKLFYNQNSKGKLKKTNFSKRILNAMKYEQDIGGGERGKQLARMLNIRACLYCNAQYSFSYKNDRQSVSKLQLDHFFSKTQFPYFSISLYNLIPTCSYCNQKKSSKEFNLDEYVHPYIESFSDCFEFRLTDASQLKTAGKFLLKEQEIDIMLDSSDPRVQNHDSALDLTGIYSNFKREIRNIYIIKKAYPKIKKSEMMGLDDGQGNKLFDDENDLLSLLFNIPLEESQINMAPLTKLKQDFWKQ
jgi:hypothetical protein